VRFSIPLVIVLGVPFANAYAQAESAPPAAESAPPAAESAPPPLMDVVPAFVGACMDPGTDADKIRETLLKAGGVPAGDQAGKADTDPTRLSGFIFKKGKVPFSVLFNRAGSCSVFTQSADVEKSKLTFERFLAGASTVFDLSSPKDITLGEGETIIASRVLTSKKTGSRLLVTLSTVTRKDQGSATIMRRRILPK